MNGLYYAEVCFFYNHFVESFVMNKCRILLRFFVLIEIIIGFLFFSLLISCITLIYLWILNPPCILGINPA